MSTDVAGTPASAAQGATISAKATITFDVNAPIDTNTHTNTVDGAVPASALTVGNAACNGQIALTRAGTDDGSGVAGYELEVSADRGDWSAVTGDTFTGLPGHDYAFRLSERDAVGNAEPKPATGVSRSVPICDTTPPRTTATAPAGAVDGWYGGAVDVKLNAVDAPGGSGVASLRFAGGSVAAAAATAHVGAEGVSDLVFSAVDADGNVEPDAQLPVRIDTTAPTVTATDGATYSLGQSVAPDVTCADAGVGIATCRVPGRPRYELGGRAHVLRARDRQARARHGRHARVHGHRAAVLAAGEYARPAARERARLQQGSGQAQARQGHAHLGRRNAHLDREVRVHRQGDAVHARQEGQGAVQGGVVLARQAGQS